MKILQLTCHFSPNTGGVETHLDDLVSGLSKRKHKTFVLAYQPLTTKAKWKVWEKSKNVAVIRIPWISGLFYRLVNNPILEFVYLFPGLFTVAPFVIFSFRPEVIHTHGLVAGAVGILWGKVFGIKTSISLHSIYHFPKDGLYTVFVKFIFQNADTVFCLSNQSADEVKKLGIQKEKIVVFTYWVDLNKFKRVDNAKKKLGWSKFTVLYVGRLVPEKGVSVLLKSIESWDENINLAIAGSGPLQDEVEKAAASRKNLKFLGKVSQEKLPKYYSAADIVIVPSIHEEGFGRVILESLACGTPVIAANRGAIPEAMDESVGMLIEITPGKIKDSVEYLYKNKAKLETLAKSARKYAKRRYSEKNADSLITD